MSSTFSASLEAVATKVKALSNLITEVQNSANIIHSSMTQRKNLEGAI